MDNRTLLGGVAVGAALALALDPDRGARRRALIRDKVVRGTRVTRRAVNATAADMANRTRGVVATITRRVQPATVDDARLVERVRATLGRVCSHPRAMDVDAVDGEVTLRGPILAREVRDVLSAVASVPGVRTVINEVEAYEWSEGIPALQGESRRPGATVDVLQRRWAPAARALVALTALAAGGAALAAFARR